MHLCLCPSCSLALSCQHRSQGSLTAATSDPRLHIFLKPEHVKVRTAQGPALNRGHIHVHHLQKMCSVVCSCHGCCKGAS